MRPVRGPLRWFGSMRMNAWCCGLLWGCDMSRAEKSGGYQSVFWCRSIVGLHDARRRRPCLCMAVGHVLRRFAFVKSLKNSPFCITNRNRRELSSPMGLDQRAKQLSRCFAFVWGPVAGRCRSALCLHRQRTCAWLDCRALPSEASTARRAYFHHLSLQHHTTKRSVFACSHPPF